MPDPERVLRTQSIGVSRSQRGRRGGCIATSLAGDSPAGVHGPRLRRLFREAVRVVLTGGQDDADAVGSKAKAASRALSAGPPEQGALPPRARRGRRRAASWLARPAPGSPREAGLEPKECVPPLG